MSDFLAKPFYGNTVYEWLIALGIGVGTAIAAKLLYWLFSGVARKITAKTKSRLDDIVLDMVEEPIVLGVVVGGFRYAIARLHTSAGALIWVDRIFQILIVLNIAWLLTRLFEALFQEYIVPLAEKTETDLDDQLLPIARKSVKISIWMLAIVVALNNAGYDVAALLAGMGIGGLALAMASRDTVANVFGGVTIFADQPFKLNDRVKVGGFDGKVKEIGIRSTRIETLEGRIVTIPNATFADSPVENISLEPRRKVLCNLGLIYDTSAEQMRLAMKLLHEITERTEGAVDELVSFNAFGDFAMNILFIYYIVPEADILDTQSAINLQILEEFGKNGLEMAFPTQTIYHKAG